jgi:hypothetical protein
MGLERGNTGDGSDSAAIVKATSATGMFGPGIQERLKIRDILAMPFKKKW